MNIISNAVKYNRVGGEIRLGCCEKTSADPETAQIEFTCADTCLLYTSVPQVRATGDTGGFRGWQTRSLSGIPPHAAAENLSLIHI